jgi:hypothetical protein
MQSCYVFSLAFITIRRWSRAYWRLDESCCGDIDDFCPTDYRRIIDRSADTDKFFTDIIEN